MGCMADYDADEIKKMKNNKYDGRAELGINKRLAKALNKDLVTAYEEGFENGKLQTKEELKTQILDKIDKFNMSLIKKLELKKEIKEIFER
jgi:hypothetical protein